MGENDVALVRAFLSSMPEDWVVAYGNAAEEERMSREMSPLLHPDFELHAPAQMTELGMPAVAGAPWNEWFGEWLTAFASYTERYTGFVDAGPGRVLVDATIGGTTATGGVEITREAAAVYTIEGGLIRSIALYLDHREARAAAGLV